MNSDCGRIECWLEQKNELFISNGRGNCLIKPGIGSADLVKAVRSFAVDQKSESRLLPTTCKVPRICTHASSLVPAVGTVSLAGGAKSMHGSHHQRPDVIYLIRSGLRGSLRVLAITEWTSTLRRLTSLCANSSAGSLLAHLRSLW